MASITWRGKNKDIAWLDYRTKAGERVRERLGKISKRSAEKSRLKKELELNEGIHVANAGITLSEFALEYLSWRESRFPDSQERIEGILDKHLAPMLGNAVLSEIKVSLGEKYQEARLKEGAKADTVNKEIRTLMAMLNKAVEREYLQVNPLKGISHLPLTDSKPPRFYTKEELEKIYCMAPYNWYWWKLLANTGMRRSEALQAKWEHIKDGYIHILSEEGSRTKSRKWRKVPLSPGALQALERLKKDKTDEYLFPRQHKDSFSRAFKRVLARTDIAEPKGSEHSLRHTFISHLVMQGKPLRLVQQLAGHANIATTEKYAHLSPDFMDGATDNLEL